MKFCQVLDPFRWKWYTFGLSNVLITLRCISPFTEFMVSGHYGLGKDWFTTTPKAKSLRMGRTILSSSCMSPRALRLPLFETFSWWLINKKVLGGIILLVQGLYGLWCFRV